MNFFRDRKLKVYFCLNYLFSNELTGYVDLSDFNKTRTKSLSRISAPKGVRLLRKSKYFSRDVPLSKGPDALGKILFILRKNLSPVR